MAELTAEHLDLITDSAAAFNALFSYLPNETAQAVKDAVIAELQATDLSEPSPPLQTVAKLTEVIKDVAYLSGNEKFEKIIDPIDKVADSLAEGHLNIFNTIIDLIKAKKAAKV